MGRGGEPAEVNETLSAHTATTLTARRDADQADGVLQRLHRMTHPGVAREHRLRPGLRVEALQPIPEEKPGPSIRPCRQAASSLETSIYCYKLGNVLGTALPIL